MDVSKNRGTWKWMVYFMENPIKMDDLETPIYSDGHESFLSFFLT